MRFRSPLLLLLAATPALIGADAPPRLDGTQWAQLTIHERVIIRIPLVAAPPPPAAGPAATATFSRQLPPPQWIERRAPKCVAASTLTGAQVGGAGDLDLIVGGVKRLRAKLDDDCPALDFYSGFYVKKGADGNICAGRDVIRSRSGTACAIRAFKTLVAAR